MTQTTALNTDVSNISEQQMKSWVNAAKAGDNCARGALYKIHIYRVRRLLTGVIGQRSEVDDLSHEVFIQVFKSIKSFNGDSQFHTWLHRLTINVALSWLRKKQRTPQMVPHQGAPVPFAHHTQEKRLEMESIANELYQVLDTISPKRRIAFVLFEIEQFSLNEIAKMTHSHVATIKSRLFFARKEIMKKAQINPALREFMSEIQGE